MTPHRSPLPAWCARTAAGLLTDLLLAGCSALPGLGSGAATPAAPAPAPAPAAPATPGAAAPVGPATPTGAAAAPAGAQSDDLGGDYSGGRLSFSVVDLTVRDRLTVLRLQLLAEGTLGSGAALSSVLASAGQAGTNLAPELLDPVHLKAYSEAEGGIDTVEGISTQVVSGRPTTLTFHYAAPQDAATAFDVVLGTGLPTFRDVPLGR